MKTSPWHGDFPCQRGVAGSVRVTDETPVHFRNGQEYGLSAITCQ